MRTRPDTLRQIALPSGSCTVDAHGYLLDPADWSEEFAEHAAREEGIALTGEHWNIIRFMRAWQVEHGIAADARFVLKYLQQRDGLSKRAAKQTLFALFPYGYVKQACRIAGMKQPRAWSTG